MAHDFPIGVSNDELIADNPLMSEIAIFHQLVRTFVRMLLIALQIMPMPFPASMRCLLCMAERGRTFRHSGSLSFQRQAHGAPVEDEAFGETERVHAQAAVQR